MDICWLSEQGEGSLRLLLATGPCKTAVAMPALHPEAILCSYLISHLAPAAAWPLDSWRSSTQTDAARTERDSEPHKETKQCSCISQADDERSHYYKSHLTLPTSFSTLTGCYIPPPSSPPPPVIISTVGLLFSQVCVFAIETHCFILLFLYRSIWAWILMHGQSQTSLTQCTQTLPLPHCLCKAMVVPRHRNSVQTFPGSQGTEITL